ncbi:MAG: fbpA 3 [Noviherbaspirillum sp.]|nr:fbpA 3 [Noviherbaspirillum sp.]
MNRSMLRPGLMLMLASLSFQAFAPAAAQSRAAGRTVAEVALDDGPDRMQRLIAGAKKEGELVLYGSMTAIDQEVFLEAFTKKYGIKIKNWRSGSEGVLQKVVSEAKAGRFEADIVDNNVPEMEALHREKLLQPVKSPHHRDIMPAAIPKHGEWVGNSIDIFVQAYNTEKVKKEELPKTYRDLLAPKWKGRLGIEGADHHWFAAVLDELGHDEGMKLFKEITSTNGISVRKGHTLLANMVASGEVPLALTVYDFSPPAMKQKGAPIESFVIPPAIGQLRAIGLLKRSPNPHAAMLYYDYMLSEEGQQILANRSRVPTSTKIETAWKNVPIKLIDPARYLDMNEKWLKDYEAAVTKRGRE